MNSRNGCGSIVVLVRCWLISLYTMLISIFFVSFNLWPNSQQLAVSWHHRNSKLSNCSTSKVVLHPPEFRPEVNIILDNFDYFILGTEIVYMLYILYYTGKVLKLSTKIDRRWPLIALNDLSWPLKSRGNHWNQNVEIEIKMLKLKYFRGSVWNIVDLVWIQIVFFLFPQECSFLGLKNFSSKKFESKNWLLLYVRT